MKGVIFRGFLEFVEQQYDIDYLESLLSRADLPSGGAYTNIGTYDHNELLTLITLIVSDKQADVNALVESFGYFTFTHLRTSYPQLINDYKNSFQCIYHVDQTIHKSVRKIHPDAQLPDLHAELSEDQQTMTLSYQSERPFVHFTLGLIKGCIDYFNDHVSIDLTAQGTTHAVFTLNRVS